VLLGVSEQPQQLNTMEFAKRRNDTPEAKNVESDFLDHCPKIRLAIPLKHSPPALFDKPIKS